MKPITLFHPRSPFLIDDTVFPPLGLLYLAEHIKKCGGTVQVLDAALGHTFEMAEHETIGIGFTTPQASEAFRLAHELRFAETLVAGGPHATHCSNDCLQNGFDVVLPGYAETNIARYLGLKETLPSLYPDRSALPLEQYHYTINGLAATTMMTSRGCPGMCAFCAQIDSTCQYFSASHVIQEIQDLYDSGWRAVMIFDDIFPANLRRLQKIAQGVKDLGVRFRCFARADTLTEAHIEQLAEMGVVEVGIGFESAAQSVLDRCMKKTKVSCYMPAVKKLRAAGIRIKGFFIIGLPGEGQETMQQTDDWLEWAQLDDVDFTVFQPMPGSAIYCAPSDYGLVDFVPEQIGAYKGRPGEYRAAYSLEGMTAQQIVEARDWLERKYKRTE
jgi:anaerobic magnesium-protoporphyrin IX monomethyl ester cyclase